MTDSLSYLLLLKKACPFFKLNVFIQNIILQ